MRPISAMTLKPCCRSATHVLLRPARHALPLLKPRTRERYGVEDAAALRIASSTPQFSNHHQAASPALCLYGPLWKRGLSFQRVAGTLRTMARRAVGDRGHAAAADFGHRGLAGMAALQQPQSRRGALRPSGTFGLRPRLS